MFNIQSNITPINIQGILQPKINSFLHNTVGDYVKTYLKNKISTQVDSTGNRMPIKKDSTKQIYRKHGWDTEHWFVRTGASVVLQQKNLLNAVEIFPSDPEDVLSYHHDKAPIFYMSKELASELNVLIKNYVRGII